MLCTTVIFGREDYSLARFLNELIYCPRQDCRFEYIDVRLVFVERVYHDFNFTILGGERNACKEVIQVLQGIYDARHTFHITNAKNL